MRLVLNSIRQHSEFEVEMPDSGVSLLQGHSGAGKTTLFDSIDHALFGNGSDLVTWGSSKGSIELELSKPSYLKIVRTITPYSLTVTDAAGIEYKDAAGQEVINSTIGMTEAEFSSCAYIRQGAAGSLLNLTPGEQLKFVQNLSDGVFSPEKLKESIVAVIKTEEKKIAGLTASLAGAVDQSTKLSSLLSDNEQVPPNVSEDEIKATKPKRDELVTKRDSLALDSYEIARLLRSPVHGNRYRLSIDEENYRKESAKRLSRIEELETLVGDKDGISVLESLRNAAETKKRRLAVLAEAETIRKTIEEKYPNFTPDKKLSVFIKELLDAHQNDIDTLNEEVSKLNQSVQSFTKPLECPHCLGLVSIVGGSLKKNDFHADHQKAVVESLAEKKKSLDALRFRRIEIAKIDSQVSGLMSSLPKIDSDPNLKTSEECQKAILEYSEKIKSIHSNDKELQMLRQKESFDLMTIEKLRKEVLVDSHVPPQKELFDSSELIKKQERAVQAEIDELSKILAKEAEWQSYWIASTNRKKIFNSWTESKTKETEIQKDLNDAHSRLVAALRVKELSDYASVAAIESVLDTINTLAQDYLDQLFPDDGTTIVLTNTSKTKAGEERAKIGVNIFHKGKQAKKLSNLSGGEKSRVCLAFQLALADMYNTPFLLVDEGFSGLDLESKESCLNVLRSIADKRAVVVIEHGAPESFFDQVIRVG